MKKKILCLLFAVMLFGVNQTVHAEENGVENEVVTTQVATYGISLEDVKTTDPVTDSRDNFLKMMGFKTTGGFEIVSYKLFIQYEDGQLREIIIDKLVSLSSKSQTYKIEVVASGTVEGEVVDDVSATSTLEIIHKTTNVGGNPVKEPEELFAAVHDLEILKPFIFYVETPLGINGVCAVLACQISGMYTNEMKVKITFEGVVTELEKQMPYPIEKPGVYEVELFVYGVRRDNGETVTVSTKGR